jgi:hypothetical protein
MTTSTVAPEIVAFAKGVRAALSDLPPEEIDDLTEGLEADLAESLAEDRRRTLPDPVAYAAELRLAAGLPGRDPRVRATSHLAADWARTRSRLIETVHANPALTSAWSYAVSLRPAWWLVRAWVVTWLLAAMAGMQHSFWFDGVFWVVMPVLAVVSVQWGRGRWSFRSQRELVKVGNIAAAVVLLPVLWAAASSADHDAYSEGYNSGVADASVDEPPAGLSLTGKPVTNVFAYDSAGNPLAGVQLFDQDGRPLDPFGTSPGDGQPCVDDESDCASMFVPTKLVTGKDVYNVFPLDVIASALDDEGEAAPTPGAVPTPPPAPFAQVPAVQPAATPEPVAPPNE